MIIGIQLDKRKIQTIARYILLAYVVTRFVGFYNEFGFNFIEWPMASVAIVSMIGIYVAYLLIRDYKKSSENEKIVE